MTEVDKYEFKIKLDEMKALAAAKDYVTAAEIADSINWRKVKNINLLMKVGDIYTMVERYDDARDVLLMAFDRSPIGRMIIYRLAELSVKMKAFDDAEEYYDEFVDVAPNDNLKYVLRYKISKAKGANIRTLINILEDFRDAEYSEEWLYELAYLYHQAGEHEKCIDTCDELFVWFGEGIYVERALELKMLHRPLNPSQEDKYRIFKKRKDGVKEVYPSTEEVGETVQIPVVRENVEKFNTVNLQEELAKSMQQIMEATKRETVAETMDSIKKMVEEVPYYQVQLEQRTAEIQLEKMEKEREINEAIKSDFKELLAEDRDGQISILVKEQAQEPQVQGQMNMEEVLGEWRKTQRAMEIAMQMAEQKKLESEKAMALQEAGDIMEWLVEINEKLNLGFSPTDLLRGEESLEEAISSEEKAGRLVAGVNDALQQQIEKLQEEGGEDEHELLRRIKLAKPSFNEQIGIRRPVTAPITKEELAKKVEKLPEIADLETEILQEACIMAPEQILPEDIVIPEEIATPEDVVIPEEITMPEDVVIPEEVALPEDVVMPEEITMPENIVIPEEITVSQEIEEEKVFIGKQNTKEIKPKMIEQALEEAELEIRRRPGITRLSETQKAIFSYFVPVDGMEKQICQALSEAADRLEYGKTASRGNILIQGGRGCGKTVLATALIKALRIELKKPNSKAGTIDAEILNQKDVAELLKKMAGGFLIIENAGNLNRETAVRLSLLLENDTSGVLVIMEDTRAGLNQALGLDEGFARKFTEKITIPVFTSDELVAFGRAYANDNKYEIDEVGILALYNRISNIQRLDHATTLTEVKAIIDEAIERAEKKSIQRAFSILTSRRYADNDYILLREKDFEE
ncbi:MAG: hypothetical protein J6A75_12410 [Lachnospiraceae bacterium]|nr:hypothetical protein [Lachnospiraceae bacterium]